MLPDSTVKIETHGLDKFQKLIDDGLRPGAPGPIADMFQQWAARYMAFIRRRFTVFSRGGGTWAPLADSTKAQRRGPAKGSRKAKNGSRTFSILVDTGILRNSLSPGNPGNMFRPIDGGMQVGIGPDSHGHDRITIGDLAVFHHYGKGRLPARTILVAPDEQTEKGMAADAGRACKLLEGMMGGQGGGVNAA